MAHWLLQIGTAPEIPLDSALLILGRDDACDIPVAEDHPTVSRRHASIEPQSEGCAITDLGSANGTWVNGARISQRTLCRHGDVVAFGKLRALLRDTEFVPAPVPRAATVYTQPPGERSPATTSEPQPEAGAMPPATALPGAPAPAATAAPGPHPAVPLPLSSEAALPLQPAPQEPPNTSAPPLPLPPTAAVAAPVTAPPSGVARNDPPPLITEGAPSKLATGAMVFGVMACCFAVLGLMPCFGWLNWMTLFIGGIGNILAWITVFTESRYLPSRNRAVVALVLTFCATFFGGIRLAIGGGCV